MRGFLRTIAAAAIFFAATGPAWPQITVPQTTLPHKPIVATLATALPEGAQLRGSWRLPGSKAEFREVTAHEIHVWAPPGVHTVEASGVWVLTRDVTIGEQTVPVLVDFGQYSYSAQFTVAGEAPTPVPPPTPAAAWALVVEETAERTPAQAALWVALQKVYPPEKLKILDRSNPPTKYREYFAAVGASVGLPALVLVAGDSKVAAVLPCPKTVAEFREIIQP